MCPSAHVPVERIAVFVDGWNFKCAAYDGLGLEVDFVKLRERLRGSGILVRAYYYSGEWDEVVFPGLQKSHQARRRRSSSRRAQGFAVEPANPRWLMTNSMPA